MHREWTVWGFELQEGCGWYPQVFRAQQNEEETHKAMGCKVVWHGVSKPKEGKEEASPKQCQCLSGLGLWGAFQCICGGRTWHRQLDHEQWRKMSPEGYLFTGFVSSSRLKKASV